MSSNKNLAWHFVGKSLRNGQPVPADGETLTYNRRLIMCRAGLHASRHLIDALRYAPGDTICRVRVGGEIVCGKDKLVANERTILWRVDGAKILERFARMCALDVMHIWDAPEIVVRWLRTGDDDIRCAAHTAARDATWTTQAAAQAARSAAEAATWAAKAAARAGRAAARDAEDAARVAAWATRDAPRNKYNRRLTAIVSAEHKKQMDSAK